MEVSGKMGCEGDGWRYQGRWVVMGGGIRVVMVITHSSTLMLTLCADDGTTRAHSYCVVCNAGVADTTWSILG